VEYSDLLSLTPKRKNFLKKQIPSLSLKHSNTIMTSPSCGEQQEQGHEATATLNHSNLLRERKDDVYKKYEIMQVLGNGSMVRFFLMVDMYTTYWHALSRIVRSPLVLLIRTCFSYDVCVRLCMTNYTGRRNQGQDSRRMLGRLCASNQEISQRTPHLAQLSRNVPWRRRRRQKHGSSQGAAAAAAGG
jgi:hypothetical protein